VNELNKYSTYTLPYPSHQGRGEQRIPPKMRDARERGTKDSSQNERRRSSLSPGGRGLG